MVRFVFTAKVFIFVVVVVAGVVIVVISPASFIVGGIAGVTALIVDLTSDEQLRKSAKYLKSASNVSE